MWLILADKQSGSERVSKLGFIHLSVCPNIPTIVVSPIKDSGSVGLNSHHSNVKTNIWRLSSISTICEVQISILSYLLLAMMGKRKFL